MFSTVASSARAAAPFVGSAVKHGAQAAAGLAIATKASQFAQNKARALVDDLRLTREAVSVEREQRKPDITPETQERKVS